MDTTSLREKITAYLAQQHDPVGVVRDKLYFQGLHVQDPEHSTLYEVLTQVHPMRVGGEYKGDAQDFLTADLYSPYDSLREVVVQLGDLLGERPFEGESIVVYINRLVTNTVEQILEDKN